MSEGDDRRIRQLFDMAGQAFATGRAPDGQRFLQQAEAEAPRHPLVLNEVATRKLRAADFAGARTVLEEALKGAPNDAFIWLNLAVALRGLKLADEEMAALDTLLKLEPRNFRGLLQAASLHEMLGAERAAAATFRTALQSIPRNVTLDMKPILDHAKAVVEANDRALERFLQGRLQGVRERNEGEPLRRFDKSLDTLLQKKKVYRPAPTFMYFPELPALEFYPREDFPWLDALEAATDDIRAELIAVLADGPSVLEPYVSSAGTPGDQWRELNNSRRWGVFFLWKAGRRMEENMARCPKTTAVLEAGWPRCDLPGTGPSATFSILDARTRIPPHVGVNNARLIVHLPLVVPPGCGFRVGSETRPWRPGEAFVFDDTIEHEAWNDSPDPRAVLILDVWNPYLTEAERQMVTATTTGVSEFYGQLPSYIAGTSA